MIYDGEIKGKTVSLRSAKQEDAKYIFNLRTNDSKSIFNKYKGSATIQKKWLKEQQRDKNDFFFIIENMKKEKIGVIALHNISKKKSEAEFGRWIGKGNAIENLESALLLYKFGFEQLGLQEIYTLIELKNKQVLNFHKRLGSTIFDRVVYDHNNDGFVLGVLNAKLFPQIKEKHYKIIESFL